MKLPQVEYGPVQDIRRGTGGIALAVQKQQATSAIIDQGSQMLQQAYVEHADVQRIKAEAKYNTELQALTMKRSNRENTNIPTEELVTAGIPVDNDAPTQSGAIHAAALFEKEAEQLRQRYLSEVPTIFRKSAEEESMAKQTRNAGAVLAVQNQWMHEERVAAYNESIDVYISSGQFMEAEKATAAAVSSGTLTTVQGQEQNNKIIKAKDVAPAIMTMKSGDPNAMAKEVNRLRSDDYQGPLAIHERVTLASQVESEKFRVQEAYYGNLMVGVRFGEGLNRLNDKDIERNFKAGKIDAGKRNSLLNDYYQRLRADAQSAKQTTDIMEYFESGVPMDHTRSDHKKAVDNYYSAVTGGATAVDIVSEKDPARREQLKNQAVYIAGKSQIVPKEVKSAIVGMNRSADPALAAEAAELYTKLEAVAPQALADIDEKDQIALRMTQLQMADGVPAAIAVQTGREAANKTPEERETIKRVYSEHLKSKPNSEALTDFLDSDSRFDPFFGRGVKPTMQMQADYDRDVHTYFSYTGNIDSARKMADKNVAKNYGRTEINGEPQAMKYSPEALTGVPAKVLRKYLEADIAPMVKDPTTVVVNSDRRTAMDGSYPVYYKREDGVHDLVYTEQDGVRVAVRWYPKNDVSRAVAESRAEKLAKGKEKQVEYQKYMEEAPNVEVDYGAILSAEEPL